MKILFLISIILLLLLLKKNIEPVIVSCCGGIRLNRDFKETDPKPPKNVRRCMKEWNSPCTGKGTPDCCEGKDYCKPTKEGGKCKNKVGSGYYIYDGKKKEDYSPEQERIHINERKKKDKSEGKVAESEGENGEKDGMEILNYVLIGIIIIVILVLLGLFFFSGDVSTPTKTKTKSVLDKNRVDNYNDHKSISQKYKKNW